MDVMNPPPMSLFEGLSQQCNLVRYSASILRTTDNYPFCWTVHNVATNNLDRFPSTAATQPRAARRGCRNIRAVFEAMPLGRRGVPGRYRTEPDLSKSSIRLTATRPSENSTCPPSLKRLPREESVELLKWHPHYRAHRTKKRQNCRIWHDGRSRL